MTSFELQKAKKKIRQAIDGKYAQKTVTTVAAAVGTRHVAINGNLASATLPDGASGAVEVVNAGRLASARYELRTGGTVSVVSGGGGSGGSGGISFSEADTRYYTKSQLDTGQLDLRYYTETESDARYAPLTRSMIAGNGLLGGGTLASDRVFDVNLDTTRGMYLSGGTQVAINADTSKGLNFVAGALVVSRDAHSGMTFSLSGGLALGTPISASVGSTNSVSGIQHSHAVVTSSNPGATSTILATTAAGTLTLNNGGSTTVPALVIGDGSTGRLAIGSSGWRDNGTQLEMLGSRTLYMGGNVVGGTSWNIINSEASFMAGADSTHTFGQARLSSPIGGSMMLSHVNSATNTGYAFRQTSPGATVVNAASGQAIYNRIANVDVFTTTSTGLNMSSASNVGSDNYASQTTGWRVSYAGGADFRYLFVDEMHAKSFIADLEQALAGGQIVAKSVAVLYLDFTAPAAAAATTLTVRDLPSATGMATFVNGDMIRVRNFSRAGGSLTIADCWGTVVLDTTYGTSGYDSATKTQRYTFTRSAGTIGGGNAPGAMSAGSVVKADAIILDYGTSGNGFYEVNAVDGAYGANSPYWQIVTWSGHPATGSEVNARGGKLTGLFGVAAEYGIYAGTGTTATDKYVRFSSYTTETNNLTMSWKSGATAVIEVAPTNGISLQTYDAAGGAWWTDPRAITWGLSVPTATPDGAIWVQYTATQNEMYVQARATGTRAGYIQITAEGEAATGNAFDTVWFRLEGAQASATRSKATLNADDLLIDLGNGVAGIGKTTLYNAQLLISDGTVNNDGSATLPVYSFADDPDTGVYRSAANQLNFTAGGTSRLQINATNVTAQLPLIVSGGTGVYELIKLYGGGAGSASSAFMSFYDAGGGTRYGYVGDTDTASGNIILRAEVGSLLLGDSANATAITISGGVTIANATTINQTSTSASLEPLALTQLSLTRGFLNLSGTVATGNPLNTTALGSYYGRARVMINGVAKWMALYN